MKFSGLIILSSVICGLNALPAPDNAGAVSSLISLQSALAASNINAYESNSAALEAANKSLDALTRTTTDKSGSTVVVTGDADSSATGSESGSAVASKSSSSSSSDASDVLLNNGAKFLLPVGIVVGSLLLI